MKSIVYYIAICAVCISCRASRQEKIESPETSHQQSTAQLPFYNSTISPGHCRLRGTIVSIDSSQLSPDQSNPCSKAPCMASVRIDSVLGYGASFPKPLATGNLVTVKFVFTLAPTTKDLFPNMNESYPGLTIGSTFLADIESRINPFEKGAESLSLLIYGYKTE